MTSLTGRVALVTGAGSGIGRAAASLFAEHGAAVVAADVSENGEETAADITRAGGLATFVCADASVEADVRRMVETAEKAYGRIDAAFNNAGIAGPVLGAEELEIDAWDHVMAVNVRSTWLCVKYELAAMIPHQRGTIVNTSSAAGLIGAPRAAAYSASKHGVIGLTRSVAIEQGRNGIRVNAIAPGVTQTAMIQEVMTGRGPKAVDALVAGIPLRRFAQPREIAEAALWLTSDASSFVTGHVLAVDGGLTAQ